MTSFPPSNSSLISFSSFLNSHNDILPTVKLISDFFFKLLVIFCGLTFSTNCRQVQVIFCLSIIQEQRNRTILFNVQKLVLCSFHKWHIYVVRGWAQIFIFFFSEDVNANNVCLGMSMLSSLRGRDLCTF